MTKSTNMLYQDTPEYDKVLKYIVGGILALTLVPGFVLIAFDTELAYAMLGLTVFDGLLFAAIIPRHYQVFDDRLRIKLGGPFAINARLQDIKEVKSAHSSDAFVYWGLRLATSRNNVKEIIKRRGLDIVISPSDKETFIAITEQARRNIPAADN